AAVRADAEQDALRPFQNLDIGKVEIERAAVKAARVRGAGDGWELVKVTQDTGNAADPGERDRAAVTAQLNGGRNLIQVVRRMNLVLLQRRLGKAGDRDRNCLRLFFLAAG